MTLWHLCINRGGTPGTWITLNICEYLNGKKDCSMFSHLSTSQNSIVKTVDIVSAANKIFHQKMFVFHVVQLYPPCSHARVYWPADAWMMLRRDGNVHWDTDSTTAGVSCLWGIINQPTEQWTFLEALPALLQKYLCAKYLVNIATRDHYSCDNTIHVSVDQWTGLTLDRN